MASFNTTRLHLDNLSTGQTLTLGNDSGTYDALVTFIAQDSNTTVLDIQGSQTVSGVFSATSDILLGGSSINSLFGSSASVTTLQNQISTKSNLSGATFTGGIIGLTGRTNTWSANTISATTYYSGSTLLSTIISSLAGGITNGSNVGTAEGVFKQVASNTIEFKTLSGLNLSVSTDGDNIIFRSANVRTSATNISLDFSFTDYVFNGGGGGATWTLPVLTNNIKWNILNIGTGAITLNSNAAGNDIFDMGGAGVVNSISIAANEGYLILGNGTYWIARKSGI
jgi:hypothetical protein